LTVVKLRLQPSIAVNSSRVLWKGMTMRLAWTVVAVLLVLWLVGFGLHLAGSLIHFLFVVAIAVLLIDLVSGRPSVV
jgi:Family of unknown function (DUF5670)